MIKLKDIIFEVMDKWISPSGTPSEVIDVTHKIFKVVQRDAPSYDVNHWVKIYGPVPDSDEEDVVWAIDKPIMGNQSYWYIGFYKRQKKWRMFLVNQGSIEGESDIRNEDVLNYYIDRWVKGH